MSLEQKTSSFWLGALTSLGSLIVFLVILEIGFRLLAPGTAYKRWTDRPYGYFMPSNSKSLQDKPINKKERGTFRIGILGDSFTFGPHLQYQDTFSKKLEHFLNLNIDAPKVEVINDGVSGSSTKTEALRVGRLLDTDIDLLILEITLNDAEPKLLTKREKDAIYGDAHLKSWIFENWRFLGFIARRIHNKKTEQAYIEYHTKFFTDPATQKVFKDSLRIIKEKATKNNIPVVAVTFPLFDFPIDEAYPFTKSHSIISESLKALNIPEIALKSGYKNIPPQRLQVIPGKDNHPNEIAHRIAAELILGRLVHLNLLPEKNIPTAIYKKRTEIRQIHLEPAHAWERANHRLNRQ